jgi:hypothetical protein
MPEERTAGQALGWSALIPPHRFTLTATALIKSRCWRSRATRAAHFDAPRGRLRRHATCRDRRPAAAVFQAMWLREMQRVDSVM